ncbi:MAG: VOC family protein [Flavobacteriaceae bacterium]
MRIEHLAIWVVDLERMSSFYERYFDAQKGALYHNPNKNFSSYFLHFGDGARLELMHNPKVPLMVEQRNERLGYVHMAISVGSKEKVDELTERLDGDGFEIVGKPRTTGDGYYEGIVLDPEGNRIEITI